MNLRYVSFKENLNDKNVLFLTDVLFSVFQNVRKQKEPLQFSDLNWKLSIECF